MTARSTLTWAIVTGLTLLGAVAAALQIAGIAGESLLLGLAISLVLSTLGVIVVARSLQAMSTQQVTPSPVTTLNDFIDSTPGPFAEVIIMSSGTDTYVNLMQRALLQRKIFSDTKIRVCFRMSARSDRDAKLAHFSERWSDFTKEANAATSFLPGPDFDHSLKGIAIQSGDTWSLAWGLYFRRNGITHGQELDYFQPDSRTAPASQVLTVFREIAANRPAFDSIIAAMEYRDRVAGKNTLTPQPPVKGFDAESRTAARTVVATDSEQQAPNVVS